MSSVPLSLLEDKPVRPGADVHLAVFGKHPCAADHLEDLGMTSASLVAFKQMFYVDGIGRNLGQSRWREPAPGQGLSWAHWILCTGPQGFLLARCAAGEDSRGRKQYPLVLAAHILQPAWLDQAPRLDFLAPAAAALRTETTRDGLERIRQETLARVREWTLDGHPPDGCRAGFAGESDDSPARTGVLRVLHALHHGGPQSRARVPAGETPLESAALWAGLIRSALPRCRILTVTIADERPGVLEICPAPPAADAVRALFPAPAGDPRTAVPGGNDAGSPALTTEVEFRITPEFAAAANPFVDAWIDGRTPAGEPPKPSVLTKLSRLFRRE